MQAKDGRLANDDVDITGALLYGCVQQFVNKDRSHGSCHTLHGEGLGKVVETIPNSLLSVMRKRKGLESIRPRLMGHY
jgi:hypothetical protein